MELNRREFISSAGALSAISLMGTGLAASTMFAKNDIEVADNQHKLPVLPYKYNELEPIIDAGTLELHYSKHHAAYVAGLNKAEFEIVDALGRKEFGMVDYWTKKMAFHGAGHFLHTLYWNSMTPKGGGLPKGNLKDQINNDFGNFEKFKSMFNSLAGSVEGSGWALLAYRPSDKKLVVLQIENHQKLTTWDVIPLLVIDVWEHAYYLKYQNKRADYINAWWDIAN
jgi:Fe-Mn family superoxide dismutase